MGETTPDAGVAFTAEVYRDILDAVPDPVLIVDGSGQITYANRQVIATLGYQPEELVGRSHAVLIPESRRGNHAAHVRRFVAAPTARPMGVGMTFAAVRKDGSEVPIEISLNPLGDGARRAIVVTMRDVTERTRMERKEALLAHRLASAMAIVPDAVALFDAEDRLLLCNATFRARFSSLPPPLEGRTYGELMDAVLDEMGVAPGEARSALKAKRLALRAEGAATGRKMHTPDGQCLRFFERKIEDGSTLLMVTDLTDEERIAEELREARVAAEAASRAKSEFLSSMSHELRTPLNAIVGFAQLLRRDKRDPLSPQAKVRVEQIVRAGSHLANLVDDILDLSRIESGRVSVSLAPTRLRDVLGRVSDAIEHIAAEKQLVLVQAPLPESDLTVLADQTRLIQIVSNFATNAVKYNQPGGRVVLSAARQGRDHVRISVTDTGLGIPPEKHELLFQPFQRAGQETGPIEGTGIGLAIAKRLAEMMGGAVGFTSAPGEGSCFWVEVGACAPAAAPTPRPRDPPATTSAIGSDRERVVLYIEDNAANAAFMRALFTTIENTKLLVSSTAEEGLDVAKEQHPDVVLMDVNLPGMNGIEALRVLRQDASTANIPVIALTAAASTREQNAGTRDGFSHYLVKPVQVDAVLGALASVLAAAPTSTA